MCLIPIELNIWPFSES